MGFIVHVSETQALEKKSATPHETFKRFFTRRAEKEKLKIYGIAWGNFQLRKKMLFFPVLKRAIVS